MIFELKLALLTLLSIISIYSYPDVSHNDLANLKKDVVLCIDTSTTLSILACGDINLGRKIGKKLLSGDSLYPFINVKDEFIKYDIVFGNLESQLSDQGGETQHPKHNLVFTGPPEGAKTLKIGGVNLVSTANNHAFDYGKSAFIETIKNLGEQNINFVGSSLIEDSCYLPRIIVKNNFKLAFFAVTDFLNIPNKGYINFIAFPDTSKLFPQIRKIRDKVDLILISYHGGNEYVDQPLKKTVNFAHQVIDCGADVFLGHHPHVIQGIEMYNDRLIFYSLGNFAFYQPQKYWTQKTFAVNLEFKKNENVITLNKYQIKPASAGLQPYFYKEGKDFDTVVSRLKKLSPTIKNYFTKMN